MFGVGLTLEVAHQKHREAMEAAQKARLCTQLKAGRPNLGQRLLLGLGKGLIFLGLALHARGHMASHPGKA